MMDQRLLPKYGDRVAFVHKDFPLPRHSWARKAAIAARFFQLRSEKLAVEWRRHILATLREVKAETFNQHLATFAKKHGVKPEEAAAALDDVQLAADVEADIQEGVARGVARTPTVFVNGRPFIETFTFEEIAKGIDEALVETR
jgi:protein-disulfide isomerase